MRIPRPTICILILSLFASCEYSTATTLVVSNQARPGKVAYITCHVNSTRFSICVAPGNETSIFLPDENISVTSWPPVFCEGTYNNISHGRYHERPYYLYDSHKDYEKCKEKCFIRVTNFTFDRWDEGKKEWEQIFPIMWIP
ncbi:hypothetical protein QUC31_018548 [Theobroma cacao]|uniref:Uncharacterized protein LOC18590788 n=2 Tax=Theobroma cacao TaxID=3641 RepID=A0AB32USZ6_THECC|nr:PREDICTED: uncharacterized protein LOC18590788 [Theobroma cacao]EOY34201.1 Uncharacterized protein TCM_041943 [Theobroma cacao]WRX32563.1 hypothetical protein QQP08_025050 [Theobroma cacao]